MKYLIGIPFVIAVISIVLNFILAGLLILTYTTLTQETPITTIMFERKDSEKFEAVLKDKDGGTIGSYIIDGNQWQLDVGFYKVSYIATILGVSSKYTLDRFRGRYSNIDDANMKQSKAYKLESNALVDTFSFFFDTSYGSSTYKDIKLNTLFTVYKTPTGIIVREKPILEKAETGFFDMLKSNIGI